MLIAIVTLLFFSFWRGATDEPIVIRSAPVGTVLGFISKYAIFNRY